VFIGAAESRDKTGGSDEAEEATEEPPQMTFRPEFRPPPIDA
jgi:hypothetical protein